MSFERRLEGVTTHHARPAGVVCSFQVTEHDVSAVSFEVRNVLNKDPIWSDFSDDSGILEPESASFEESAFFPACSDAEVLAGEAAADEVDWGEVVFSD